ncbi:MAG: asparagine synthase (glutamine-hydrolyzing) [Gammaproteobacteria bacterium]|nr:asparagine synthase (glutamine-hydrolyzing) [Gammaproteobacteria bacterium]
MCGITGIAFAKKCQLKFIENMTSSLATRGPNDSGIWLDEGQEIALGHRRLSIIDLSPAGHQPMFSHSGRFVITYNGEIYNYIEIRKELIKKGHHFTGSSDTEVILAAIEEWGIEQSVKKFDGMFAFAVWDRKEKILYLARDKFGEKPLYYGWVNNTFIFASELKALKQFLDWKPEISREALTLFMRYKYVPEPYSIYNNVFKLNPGHWARITANKQTLLTPYWSALETANQAINNPFLGDEQEAINELHQLLSASVKGRAISDVPLGTFLSGGIDSSLITALLQEKNSQPIKTFSIGFHEQAYNEAPYAKEVARHLGTEHYETYVTEQDALNVIPQLPSLYDEPFADSSQIPTYLVSSIARKQVTVCLSGDAGDELFGGYNRYLWANTLYDRLNIWPYFIRKSISSTLKTLSIHTWDRLYQVGEKILPAKKRVALFGQKVHKFLDILPESQSRKLFYKNIISTVVHPEAFVLNGSEPTITSEQAIQKNKIWFDQLDFISQMMLSDAINYLPGDILTKVDRAGMGVSLEGRIPFLNPKVFEFAWRLPLNYKIREGQGKYILRQLLYRYVPQKLIDRPKSGFSIPIGIWLKTSLQDWAEDLLNEKQLQRSGFWDVQKIRDCWKKHLSDRENYEHLLWNILIFQAWSNID